jgi:hypothetical protein
MIHWLKTDPHHFQRIWDGEKNYEVRKDDRGYEEGDILILADGNNPIATARRVVIACIINKLGDDQPGIAPGFATLGIHVVAHIDSADEAGLKLFEYYSQTVISENWHRTAVRRKKEQDCRN